MSEEDLKYASTQLLDGSSIIKQKFDREAIFNINLYYKECQENGSEPDIKKIKNILLQSEINFRNKTSCLNSVVELVENNENYSINSYPIISNSVFEELSCEDISFFRDAFITIGGNTSSGKTSLVTQLIRDLMLKNTNAICLFYSLDDGAYFGMRKTMQHFTQYYNQINSSVDIKLPKYTEPISRKYLEDFDKNDINIKDALNRIIISENYDNIEADIEIVKAKIANIEQTKKPLLIIALDYLHILPNDDAKELRIFCSETMKYLKEIQQKEAKEGGCIFFMLSQLNRSSSTNNNVGINSFRESSEIENLSDIALTIDYIKSDNENQEPSTDRIIKIVKNKIGAKKNYIAEIKDGIITKLKTSKDNGASKKQREKSFSNAGKILT